MLRFVKYHGLGNDFILVDGISAPADLSADDVIRLCDRHFGIGADGVILVLPSPSGQADCRMRLLNSDGSEGEMCGNGLRCLARFVWDVELVRKTEMAVETLAGIKRPHLHIENDQVIEISVQMGQPHWLAREVPTTLVPLDECAINVPLDVDGTVWNVTLVNTGVPHCVVFVPELLVIDWQAWGPRIERHPAFPHKANVMFTQVIARDHLQVRPWERGAGPTLACGTGACAAVVAAAVTCHTERDVHVTLPGGSLRVQWETATDVMVMTGPAERVFSGEIETASGSHPARRDRVACPPIGHGFDCTVKQWIDSADKDNTSPGTDDPSIPTGSARPDP
jgi:diaminopimelate epimerase